MRSIFKKMNEKQTKQKKHYQKFSKTELIDKIIELEKHKIGLEKHKKDFESLASGARFL